MKQSVIIFALLVLLPTGLFAADAAVTHALARTIDHGAQYHKTATSHCAWGQVVDTAIIGIGDAAYDTSSILLFGPILMEDFSNYHAWVYYSSQVGDSMTDTTTADSVIVQFQTSFNGQDWYHLSGVDVDTVLADSLTNVCEIPGHTRSASVTTKFFGRYLRALAHYHTAIGSAVAAPDTNLITFEYGFLSWR